MTRPRKGQPHEPVLYEDATVYAIRALADGIANEGQQKAALNWIVRNGAGYYDISYRADDDGGATATAFAEGRRFVGAQIVKMLQPELTPKPKKKESDKE